MTEASEELVRIDGLARRLGLSLVEVDSGELARLASIRCAGRVLPVGFAWFCARYRGHAGWPHNGWPGVFSPFGEPSQIEVRNAWRREAAGWPEGLVSFSGTDDGDYCFDYSGGGEPVVVYVDDWGNPAVGEEGRRVVPDRVANCFGDWLAGQVEWVLGRRGARGGGERSA